MYSTKEVLSSNDALMQEIQRTQKEFLKCSAIQEKFIRREKEKKMSILLPDDIKMANLSSKFRKFSQLNQLDRVNHQKSDQRELPIPQNKVMVNGMYVTRVPLVLPPIYKQHIYQPQKVDLWKGRRVKDAPLSEICKSRYLRMPIDYNPYGSEEE